MKANASKCRERILVFCKDLKDFKSLEIFSGDKLTHIKSSNIAYQSHNNYVVYIPVFTMSQNMEKGLMPDGIIITDSFKDNPEYNILSRTINLILGIGSLFNKQVVETVIYNFKTKEDQL